MPAQTGNALVLSYGEQGSRQAGDALVLDYAVAVTSRRIAAGTRAPWARSASVDIDQRALHGAAIQKLRALDVPWDRGAPLNEDHGATWAISLPRDDRAHAPWGRYEGRPQPENDAHWGISTPSDRTGQAPWDRYEGRPQPESIGAWAISAPADDGTGMPWGGPMLRAEIVARAAFSRSTSADHLQFVPWTRFGRIVAPSWGIVVPVADPNAPPEALYVVPVKKVYIVLNTVTLRRVDGDVPLPALAFSVKLDDGSWVWSFNATLPGAAQQYVESTDGAPVELEASINGTLFRLLVDSISRDRAFKSNTITIQGRGKAALLDAPYSGILTFSNAEARTAQQLAGEALAMTEIGADWTINWGITDWLVPAGAWSSVGTQIGALNAIAAAAGAYIQPHTSDLSLSVLARYPFAPWDWAAQAPDYELPSDVVTRESIQWAKKPVYNRVFVSGQGQGILGQVTRAGTAGDQMAPMVTDALITDTAAARQRGLAALAPAYSGLDGDARNMAMVSLRLPVLPETGVILPGKLVRYIDQGVTRVGISRSAALDIAMPGVWQTIGVETHVD